MLPFLKPKSVGIAIDMKKIKPDEDTGEGSYKDDGMDPGLMAAADALKQAIQAEDTQGIAQALKDAFDICDSMPHEEGEHLESETE